MHQKAKYNNISSVEKVKCELKQEKKTRFYTHIIQSDLFDLSSLK